MSISSAMQYPFGEPIPPFPHGGFRMINTNGIPSSAGDYFKTPEITPDDFNKIDWGKTHQQPWIHPPFAPPIGDPIDQDAMRKLVEQIAKQTDQRIAQEVLQWKDRYDQAVAEHQAIAAKLAEARNEVERLKKENRNLRLRAGLARTVEDEPEGS